MLDKEKKTKALELLNEANEILGNHLDTDDEEIQEGILCPLGEAISNVYNLEVE